MMAKYQCVFGYLYMYGIKVGFQNKDKNFLKFSVGLSLIISAV